MFLLLSLFCCSNIANAQEYVPIPDKHIWSVSDEKLMTYGDTLINNKEYLKVYRQHLNTPFEFDISLAEYFCALRNDTLNKRVYMVCPFPMKVYEYPKHFPDHPLFITTDTTELLLYDFSLGVGDTVSVYEFNWTGTLYKVKMKRVEDVILLEGLTYSNTDSLQILENGDYRKRVLMCSYYDHLSPPFLSTAWIEGVGSIHGLTRHFLDSAWPEHIFLILLCYANEQELLLTTPWNVNDNCHRRSYVGSINENRRKIELTIYPNPASGFIKIKNINEGLINNCWIEIFDVYGKMVLRQKYEEMINISALRAGYYFVKISDVRVNIKSKGFVKF